MSERPQTPKAFIDHLAIVTRAIGSQQLDADLEQMLNRDYAADGPWFAAALAWCRQGSAEGWLCGREAGGIRFGRAVAPCEELGGMSIDVVEMTDVVGPHHIHPQGEIDLVMPLEGDARFDGNGAGWTVYPPGSAHHPTVSGGKALVLYLLPGGAIEFARS